VYFKWRASMAMLFKVLIFSFIFDFDASWLVWGGKNG
jgi:hypothetical protein